MLVHIDSNGGRNRAASSPMENFRGRFEFNSRDRLSPWIVNCVRKTRHVVSKLGGSIKKEKRKEKNKEREKQNERRERLKGRKKWLRYTVDNQPRCKLRVFIT